MKPTILILSLCVFALTARAQDASKPADKPAAKQPTQEELEAKFKKTMTKATFVGRWCMVKDGKPGPEREEKYVIYDANKVSGDSWIIRARLQYGNKDLTVPIPVTVKWAGDTPVISLTDLAIPGAGTYTARVLVYGNQYAGTWSGGDHGGLLNGAITNATE
ncbi:MAG: hypothetical protein AB1705_23990 [Verrucomicrobiota bacterium]